MPILERIFPKAADNRYRGHAAALWLFGLLVIFKALISVISLAGPARGFAADGIPLNTYPAAAAQAVVGVGVFLDVELLMLVLIFVLTLVRYRALVPLMYLVLVVEFLARRGAALRWPIPRTGVTPASYFVLGLFVLTLIGLGLAVTGRGYRLTAKEGPAGV
ncbi:MAG TPA: hypothetical protein VK801_10915 [Caulobacteraceae bacterium]|jgi:hypothetical protein|nr:hypothetical protein [Caulobacteraceae bacterium]